MLTINPKITFNGMEAREGILDPAFNRPNITSIMSIRQNMKAQEQIAFLGRISKVAQLDPGCGLGKGTKELPMEEKFWDPKRIKIWFAYCEDDLEDTFFVWGTANGVAVRDLTQNPQFWVEWVLETFQDAANEDTLRFLFLGDTAIDDIGSGGVLGDAADIPNYNQLDGIWKQIFTGVTANSIKRIVVDENYGAFATGNAEVTVFGNLPAPGDTVTIGSTVFTAIAGVPAAASADFQAASTNEATANSLKTQINGHPVASTEVVASIDTSNPANVLLKAVAPGVAGNALALSYTDNGGGVGIVVSGAGFLAGGFEANYESQENLGESRARELYRKVFENADSRLKTAPDKIYLVTSSLFDNRVAEKEARADKGLESGAVIQDTGQDMAVDVYRNIPVYNMENVWDRWIKADFDNGVSYDIPNRVILTTRSNLVAGFDSIAAHNSFISYYDEETEETNLKGKYKVDVHVMRDFLISVAY